MSGKRSTTGLRTDLLRGTRQETRRGFFWKQIYNITVCYPLSNEAIVKQLKEYTGVHIY